MNVLEPAGLRAVALAAMTALFATSALAQSWRSHCISAGPLRVEPLGDREGHALNVSASVCRVEGGPMDGGVTTQENTWEIDKTTWTSLSADSVTRVPGGILVYRGSTGTLNLQTQDGRPAGWTASGRGLITLAVGRGASLAGKAVVWTGRATGPGTFVIDATVE